jgi:hypothetical protein
VTFCDPPHRGLAEQTSERERALTRALRQAPPGHYVELAVVASHAEAETIRRRVGRGRGPWEGCRWSVAVRKTSGGLRPQWKVYVARGPVPE